MQTVIAPFAPSKPATPIRPADARNQRTSGFTDLMEGARGEVDETPRPRDKVKVQPRDRDLLANTPIAPEAELLTQQADGKKATGNAIAASETAPMDRPTEASADGPTPAATREAAGLAQPVLEAHVAAPPVTAPQVAALPIAPMTPATMKPDATVIAPDIVDAETSPTVPAAPLLMPAPAQAQIAAAAGLAISNPQIAPISGELVPATAPQAPLVNSPVVAPPVVAVVPDETSLKVVDARAVASSVGFPVDKASSVRGEIRPTEEVAPALTPTTWLEAMPTSATPAPDPPATPVNSASAKPVEAALQSALSQPVQAETSKPVAKAEQPADASRADKVEKDKSEKGETARAEALRSDQPRAELRLTETAAPRAVEVTARALDPTAPQHIQVTSVPSANTPQTLAADIAARVGAQAAAPSAVVPVHQLAVTIAARANAGNTRFDIRLDPAELGRIDVTMTLDREGRAKARIVVEKQETYELLRQDQRNLEKALGQAGAKIGDGSVEFQLRADTGDTGRGREGREPLDRQPGLAGHDDMPAPELPAIALYARLAAARGGVDLRI